MGKRLQGRVAVITGSGQGMGRAIAVAMAQEGASVVTNNRRPGTPGGDAATVAGEITASGGRAVPFFGDVSGFDVAQRLVQTALDEFGRIDILVNNAGASDVHKMVWEMTEGDWDSTLDVHLKGCFNCIRHAAGRMKEQGWGRILNATSTAWLGVALYCNYVAAKAGMVGLTRAVALDVAPYGVTCNAYAPKAATRRLITEEKKANFAQRYRAGLISRELYHELINPPAPETVAPFLVYLCTEEAGGVNGQVFNITGGSISIYSQPAEQNAIRKESGLWTVDELAEIVPRKLLKGYHQPAA